MDCEMPDSRVVLENDWEVIVSHLPRGWEEQARICGAVRRARRFGDAQVAMRTLLVHLALGCSLVETAARIKQGGLASVSPVAVMKLLRRSEDWLHWIASELSAAQRSASMPARAARWRVCVVDGTSVSEPGSTGTDWRVHYALDLRTLRCLFFELTDVHGAEQLSRFPASPGDLFMGDRIYATPAGLRHIVDQGAAALVRMTATTLPLEKPEGGPFALFRHLRSLRKAGSVGDWTVRVPGDSDGGIEGRVCAVRRTKAAAELAEQHLRRRLQRKQQKPGELAIAATRYVFVFTTVDRETLSGAEVLELYRGRWQIEICFKRLKSLMNLGHLPNRNAQSARSWLYGKLVAGFLVERLVDDANSFSPWGHRLALQTPELELCG